MPGAFPRRRFFPGRFPRLRPLRPTARAALVAGVLFVAGFSDARAQGTERHGDFGLGGQVGTPTGLTVKWYPRRTFAFDVLARWNLEDFFNLHGLREWSFDVSPLHVFLGPGVVLGRDEASDDPLTGLSGMLGANFFLERFEVHFQVTPRVLVSPDLDGELGWGVGLRYYF